ncbi:MAG: M48 family metallopeptidase [Phycisphaerales bacterium]|nr:MAG: M48 family metallopeptidase [Phycisphaerales bacterium]
MAVDFFESQDVARKKTGRLVLLFILAVIAIIVMVYIVIGGVVLYAGSKGGGGGASLLANPLLFAAVAGGTILVIGLGSLYKIALLRGGGKVVAESLGGRLLHASTTDRIERRLLNVVEEMAIASGTPTPPVYLMDNEQGINAFAAGFSPSDAVIGVTRGCAEQLTRDELQGVIAHEFSHILNGDMRLNIRLMGVLFGILMIGVIGYFLLRSSFFAGHSRRSGRGGGAGAILAIGAGLALVGFAGTFFGNLIKAAVSRQREYLADASSVQFTRNPQGIAGALKRIGGFTAGSAVANPNAPEASHMFFGKGITSGFNALFATHPPLPERIRRIDPSWDGKFIKGKPSKREWGTARPAAVTSGFAATARGQAAAVEALRAAGSGVSRIGLPTEAHIEYASQLVQSIPAQVVAAAHEPYGARAVVYCLLVDKEPQARQLQLGQLAHHADPGVCAEMRTLLPIVEQLDAKLRLPLLDMALPALRELSPGQYQAFRNNIEVLVRADERIDLFEWTLQRVLLNHLEPEFGRVRTPRARYHSLSPLRAQCEVLLSTLAHVGHRDEAAAQTAFAQAAKHLPLPQTKMKPTSECGLNTLDNALNALATVAPRPKRDLVNACAACVAADREVTVEEAELLRAVADSLGCPMPPLLPGQPLV